MGRLEVIVVLHKCYAKIIQVLHFLKFILLSMD